MKTPLILIILSLLYLTNAAPLKHRRGPKTTTDAGFIARYFHIPEFLKFSANEKPTEPPIRTLELPQKSRLSKILDSINIFKKEKPFGEPYLRAYIQPDGSYKWYFVYPGQMLYPAPDEFSFDTINQTLHKTIPTTTTTTTTTTKPPPEELDGTPKPLYPLMGKIEFIKNGTEPKENKWAVTMSDSGPIFQPYGKIQPPFDEPLLQQLQSDPGNDQVEQEPQEEPEQENQSVTRRKNKKHTRTPKPEEEESPVEQNETEAPVEDDQVADEPQDEAQEDNPAEYDNAEQDENQPSAEENNPDEENEPQSEDAQTDEDEESQDDERTSAASPVTKVKSRKSSAT